MALEQDGPTDAHRAVLELLAMDTPPSSRSDLMRLSPSCLARSAGFESSNYIVNICRELQEQELIDREDPGYYAITWRGRGYLEGEITLDG